MMILFERPRCRQNEVRIENGNVIVNHYNEITKINNTKNAIMISENLIRTKGFNNCVILVNDGSTDISLEVCQIYSRVDNRIKVINNENQGV